MFCSKIKKILCITASALLATSIANAEQDDSRIKARLGYLHAKENIKAGSNGTAAQQKFEDDFMGEIALSHLFTNNFALEFSAGAGSLAYKSNDGTKKDIFFIPVSGIAQLHLPINDKIDTYMGAGYSYTFIAKEPSGTTIENGGGPVFQVGTDIFTDGSFGLNLDVKYILDAKHDIKVGSETFKNKLSSLKAMVGITIPF